MCVTNSKEILNNNTINGHSVDTDYYRFLGVDTAVCTYGSLVEFRKGSTLKLTPMKATIYMLLINSKIQRETKTLVAKVAELHRNYPSVIDNIFDAMEEISVLAIKKLKTLSTEGGC